MGIFVPELFPSSSLPEQPVCSNFCWNCGCSPSRHHLYPRIEQFCVRDETDVCFPVGNCSSWWSFCFHWVGIGEGSSQVKAQGSDVDDKEYGMFDEPVVP